MTIKRMKKYYIDILKINMVDTSLDTRSIQIDGIRNNLLDVIKHNDLMS